MAERTERWWATSLRDLSVAGVAIVAAIIGGNIANRGAVETNKERDATAARVSARIVANDLAKAQEALRFEQVTGYAAPSSALLVRIKDSDRRAISASASDGTWMTLWAATGQLQNYRRFRTVEAPHKLSAKDRKDSKQTKAELDDAISRLDQMGLPTLAG